MHVGLSIFPTSYSLDPRELGPLIEARGYESVWHPEHTHFPVTRDSAYPGQGDMPREYGETLDPFVSLAVIAAHTTRIKLGTAICLIAQRDPITTAKVISSLDQVSDGRVILGVGLGWNREEMKNHGTDPRTRTKLLGERVEAMRAIWTSDEAEYHGEFVDFAPITQWPKPVQDPHPPVLVGGSGPTVLERVVRYGDAWFPSLVGGKEEGLDLRIQELQKLAADAGRGPIPVSLNGAPTDPERLARYAEWGIERVTFFIPSAGRAEIETRMDEIDAAMRQAGLAG